MTTTDLRQYDQDNYQVELMRASTTVADQILMLQGFDAGWAKASNRCLGAISATEDLAELIWSAFAITVSGVDATTWEELKATANTEPVVALYRERAEHLRDGLARMMVDGKP